MFLKRFITSTLAILAAQHELFANVDNNSLRFRFTSTACLPSFSRSRFHRCCRCFCQGSLNQIQARRSNIDLLRAKYMPRILEEKRRVKSNNNSNTNNYAKVKLAVFYK